MITFDRSFLLITNERQTYENQNERDYTYPRHKQNRTDSACSHLPLALAPRPSDPSTDGTGAVGRDCRRPDLTTKEFRLWLFCPMKSGFTPETESPGHGR